MASTAERKAELRACYRRRRRALSAADQSAHAEAVAAALVDRLGAGPVGMYVADDGEVDLAPLIAHCWQRGIAVALPVIRSGRLAFASHAKDDALHRACYGVLEPERAVAITPALVLVPLVAFDAHGHRLGRGGGYYDRYFAANPSVERIGIAHECQRAKSLPSDDWDVPLPAVVTELGWQRLPISANAPSTEAHPR